MLPRVALLAALLLSASLAGCAQQAEESTPATADAPPAHARPIVMDWSKGNWWAYRATLENVTFDIALIVHEETASGYRLGTNLSAGFFGLPWAGNVTPERNPRIGADEWALFDFPLSDGKEWSYSLLGYDAKTVARATTIALPDGVGRAGYRMESSAYGQLFARYDYVEEVGWFTHLTLVEPTDGHTVLDARLTAFGNDWDEAYYVEEVVRKFDVDYPVAPGALSIDIPAGYLQLRATLTAEARLGLVDATLRNEDGRVLAEARATGRGAQVEHTTARAGDATTWRLDHLGAGVGRVHVEITGLSASGPLAEPQSTRPLYPQLGQTTSLALPSLA